MHYLISCMACGKQYPVNFSWYVCDKCNFRVCPGCVAYHKGLYSSGGKKCSQCQWGYLKPAK
jgi:hypothetical protein